MSSLGDLYYLGLNAIEFFDAQGKRILLEENSAYSAAAFDASKIFKTSFQPKMLVSDLAAYPESVNVLDWEAEYYHDSVVRSCDR